MTQESLSTDDPSLQQLLSDYLEQIDRGAQIDRQKIMRDHPKHADSLIAFLDDHARMREIVAPLRAAKSP